MEHIEISEEEKKQVYEKVARFQEEVLASWRKPHQNPTPTNVKTVYCIAFYDEQVGQVAKCLRRVTPYVNRCVLVHDGTLTTFDIDKLHNAFAPNCKVEFVYRKWDDHLSKQRNAYLDRVEEGEWVIVSDPDELFNVSFLKDMRAILIDAEKGGMNSLLINAHDIIKELEGATTTTTSTYKQLIFKMEEGVRYVGRVHETLLPGIQGWRNANLDPQYYYYEHHRTRLDLLEHEARNVFIGGGGINVLDKNPMYAQWHKWAKQHNIQSWPHMRAYIKTGHIEDDLLKIFIDHRNDSGWDYENESRAPFVWIKVLFPEEMKGWDSNPQLPSQGSPPEVMAYVEQQYQEILGRNADEKGKQLYADSILAGSIKREQLPEMLKNSEEYKQKHPLDEALKATDQTLAKMIPRISPTKNATAEKSTRLEPNGDFIFYEQDWLRKRFSHLEFVKSPKYPSFKAALNLFLQNNGQIIVETGTQRLKDDPGGSSTTLFGAFCKRYSTKLFTVDINPANMKVSKECTEEFKDYIGYMLTDSVKFLKEFEMPIGLLYLDSLDCPLPPMDATEAQTQNLRELKAAYDKLHKGSLVLIDDNNFENGGKSRLSKKYLLETGEWLCIMDAGQTLWMKRC